MRLSYLFVAVSILLAVCIISTPCYAEIDPKTVVGIWLLDSNNGGKIKDSGSNNLDGRIVGNSTIVEGKFGKGLELQKGDYTEVTNTPALEMNDQLTIVMWTKGEPQDGWHRLIDKKISSVVGWEVQAWSEKDGFGVRVDTTDKDNQCTKVDGVLDGTWHHVAFVLDSGAVKVYKDGVKTVDSTYQVGEGFSNQDNLQIGTTNFAGAFDEVAIFNIALEDDDIKEIMEDGLEKATGVLQTAVSSADRFATTWAGIKNQ